MAPEIPGGLPGVQGPQPAQPERAPAAPPRPEGEFARILEELQELEARTRSGAAAERPLDPGELVRRLDEADDSFRRIMEIRSRLEEAWRQARQTYGER